MLNKRLIVSSLIAMGISANVYAGNIYLSPMVFVLDNTSKSSNYRGLYPHMSVGYAQMFEGFYLAGEVFAVPATGTLTDNHKNAASVRSSRSYGISILPGGMITEHVMGYVRVSVLSTQFPYPNTSRAGAQLGLGMQTCLTPYWDLRAEYDYTAYKTVPSLGSVKSDQVGLGLVYKVLG